MAVREDTLFLLTLVSILSIPVDCQNCVGQISCSSCISQAGCAWCFENVFNGIRCQPAANLTLAGCTVLENPTSNITSTTESTGDLRTINFEGVRLNLRVGDPQTFRITVTPQRNLPLDLYILIDLSTSMNDELATVQSIASQIANQVRNVTTNVRLGFGSFVEKPIQPFTSEDMDGNVLPGPSGDLPYDFRHTVSFTPNSTTFAAQLVNVRTVGGNLDLPEAGFEGLAQVITCEEIIGWRERFNGVGTRLVLFMTDEEFHFAGEGRLAGIVKPYNGRCLLVPNPVGEPVTPVEYTRATEFDYPSVGQILDLLQRFDVTAIFAIAEERLGSYQNLVDSLLDERAVVAGFSVSQGSSSQDAETNILNIIESQYVRLLQRVSLDTSSIRNDVNSADVSVQVVPTCPPLPSMRVGEGCEGVELEAPVDFDITITLNSCEGLTHEQLFSHNIITSSFGSFQLDFTVICNCSCAVLGMRRDDDCMGMGVRRCAVCECDPLKCGVDCSQNIGNRSATDCPRGGVENQTCSGPLRGECDCTCICVQPEDPEQMIFGNACQCDNFRCPRADPADPNSVCSGRGMCCDGGCICDTTEEGFQYRGAAGQPNTCQCEPRERVCIQDLETGIECNGRGDCGCNFCICNRNFTGTFCNLPDVSTCGFDEDVNCIRQCRRSFSEPRIPDICTQCNLDRPLLFVNMSEITNSPATSLERIANNRLPEGAPYSFAMIGCSFEDGNCITEYHILRNETNFVIVAVRERDCSNALNLAIPVWALAPIILGCLLILGILLVILIKIIFTILDYIEVKKWQKEAQGADFSKNTNPLYQSPEMKYENVAYGKE